MTQPGQREAPFKDYCLILQLHPEADAAMVDAAYWHLARRYNDAAASDPTAKAKLDDLNEAYSVLGSAERREDYLKVRNAVLGEGALPVVLPPEPEPVPLAVMERRRPEAQGDATPERATAPARRRRALRLSFRQVAIPPWQNAVAAVVMLVLAAAAFTPWAPWPLVAGLLVAGIAFTTVPLLRRLPRLPTSPASVLRSLTAKTLRLPIRQAPPPTLDADAVREATAGMVARWREGSDTEHVLTGASPASYPEAEPPDLPEAGDGRTA